MCEYTTLTSYKEALEDEKVALENVDVEALTDARLVEVRAEIRAKIVKDVEEKKFINNISLITITNAIEIEERKLAIEQEAQEEVTDEVPTETISDETY